MTETPIEKLNRIKLDINELKEEVEFIKARVSILFSFSRVRKLQLLMNKNKY
jgi:hypothetical protein